MNKSLKLVLLLILIFLISVGAYFAYISYFEQQNNDLPLNNEAEKEITNFNQCVDAGNPVMESYPRQCRANGQTFIEEIGNELEKQDLIRIDNPRPNQTISSPTKITGKARGTWFFEASFPILLMDANGNDLGFVLANAKGEWMTEDFVDFEAELKFEDPKTDTGLLILQKDNPSGLEENEDLLIVPVKFK